MLFIYNVISLKLDDFCRLRKIYQTHMKIDIDGGELQALEGTKEILSRGELKEIFIEVNKNYNEIMKIFKENNFNVFWEKKYKANSEIILKRN
tara:strand:- start:385 stop:663 length:279 start_codon:yes stop_codon:yes gene_type:complete